MTARSNNDNQAEAAELAVLEQRLSSWRESAPQSIPTAVEERVRRRLECTILPLGQGGKRSPKYLPGQWLALFLILLATTAFIWNVYDAPLVAQLFSVPHSCLNTSSSAVLPAASAHPAVEAKVPLQVTDHCH